MSSHHANMYRGLYAAIQEKLPCANRALDFPSPVGHSCSEQTNSATEFERKHQERERRYHDAHRALPGAAIRAVIALNRLDQREDSRDGGGEPDRQEEGQHEGSGNPQPFHARSLAACPLAVPQGTRPVHLSAERPLDQTVRFVIHDGNHVEADIADEFERFRAGA